MVSSLQYGKESVIQLSRQSTHEHLSSKSEHQRKPRIAATCKHFAAYSLETNRFNFSADITDRRDWDDTYLPAFDACIHAEQFLRDYFGTESDVSSTTGGAIGLMCSYNAIDGVPACANPTFLQSKLRSEWGFDDYVVSQTAGQYTIYTNTTNMHHHSKRQWVWHFGLGLTWIVEIQSRDME